jgi:aminotransferase
MTRLANKHGAINLAQGFPDFPAPDELKEAACKAIRADVNQYAITWGSKNLREGLAKKHAAIGADPETMVTVTCGATEAMIATLMATIDPGDEVVVFEPFYENYGPDAILSGAAPRFVSLKPTAKGWEIDLKALRRAFTKRTRAIIVNTPNNPTGKVFTVAELDEIAALCRKHDVLAVTDEVYEHIVYDGATHVSLATRPGMAERTVTVSALSKTFSVTGWRLGYAIAPPRITSAIRKVHDFLTVGAPHPLQEAAAELLKRGAAVTSRLAAEYRERREVPFEGLEAAGLAPSHKPQGAYYVLVDVSGFGYPSDVDCARWMVEEAAGGRSGNSFFSGPADGAALLHRLVQEARDAAGDAEAPRRPARSSAMSCCWPRSRRRADELEAVVLKRMRECRVAIPRLKDGKVAHLKGYGVVDLESRAPVTADTPFELASCSKQFTAIGILLLMERGKLKAEDDIRTWLKEMRVHDPKRPIRVIDLVHHISGLPDYLGLLGEVKDPRALTNEGALQLIKDKPLDFKTGRKWAYSNSNYCMLALIIERITKKSFGAFMASEVFRPMGMKTAAVLEKGVEIKGRALGHHLEGKGYVKVPDGPFTTGDGGVYLSLNDWVAFEKGLPKLLKKESLERAWQNGKLDNGDLHQYGYGVLVSRIAGRTLVGHEGEWAGFRSYFVRRIEDKVTLVLLCNGDDADTAGLSAEIMSRLLQ